MPLNNKNTDISVDTQQNTTTDDIKDIINETVIEEIRKYSIYSFFIKYANSNLKEAKTGINEVSDVK
ncbi:hypothetical protein [Bacteroides sp. HPS0048]|uniref:hypothetical protein n=1 Tax=Bacteroides sp. HPS0048 TaxID=1078089 RepID=UPI00356B5EE5